MHAIGDGPSGDLVGPGVAIPRGAKEEGEIWYLVSPESWGRGVATEAAKRLLEFRSGNIGAPAEWATCLPENPASARVLEKLGMRKEDFVMGT